MMELQEIIKKAKKYKDRYEGKNEGFNSLYRDLLELKEDCYATAVKIKEENMETTNILELEFESNDLGKKVTIREFFHSLMQQLWVEKERFSGKCPFGNSTWEGDIIVLLIQKKLISGKVDEDGAIEEYSEKELEEFVKNKILKPLFSK